MTICTKNCSCKSSSGYCQLTACIYPDTMTIMYESARKLKSDGTFESIYVISESDLESSLREALNEVYKEGYYRDITFNMLCKSLKRNLEVKSL